MDFVTLCYFKIIDRNFFSLKCAFSFPSPSKLHTYLSNCDRTAQPISFIFISKQILFHANPKERNKKPAGVQT